MIRYRLFNGKLIPDPSWFMDDAGKWRRLFHEHVWLITHENPAVRVLSHLRLKLSVRNKRSFKNRLKIIKEHDGGLLVTFAGRALSHFPRYHIGFKVTRVCKVEDYNKLYPSANPNIEFVGTPKPDRNLYEEFFREDDDAFTEAEYNDFIQFDETQSTDTDD